jgi:hypothetical protein
MHQATRGWHSVAHVVTPSSAHVCGGDLALLVLSDVVPASEATPATPDVTIPLTDHARLPPTIAAIGYGLPSAAPEGGAAAGGTRRLLTDVPIECIPGDPSLACAAPILAATAPGEMRIGGGVCDGDSGSGAFAGTLFTSGTVLLLAVLSRGETDGIDPTLCAGGTYTRLDVWRDFLVQAAIEAAQSGGYPAPDWTFAPDGGSPVAIGEPSSSRASCTAAHPSGRAPRVSACLTLLAGALLLLRHRRRRSSICRKSDTLRRAPSPEKR